MTDGPSSTPDLSAVDAEPTKEFFVSMLVRDIDLADAIVDLIDNSVDGARRYRGDGPYDGLRVTIRFDSTSFEIDDNCGGVDIAIARSYAFKFGRDDHTPPLAHSIGQFGVGMKRTLFKLGEHFVVTSRTTTDSFVVDEQVEDWRTREGWNFRFSQYSDDDDRAPEDTGTTIHVDQLHPGVAAEFELDLFRNSLVRDIELKHMRALAAGLDIRVGDVKLRAEPLRLIENDDLRPARWEHTYNGKGDPVDVLLLVGVARASQADGGWYVFCNSRLVLGPDQTDETVWGSRAGLGLPGFHPEYHEFRGYAFFESANAARLPWTTTKTGVDEDSAIWKSVRRRMADLSKDVVTFLRLADRQGDAALNAGEEARADLAQTLLRDSVPIPIDDVHGADRFEYPEVDFSGLEAQYQFIRYRKSRRDYDRAADLLGVDRPADVGAKTFDFFLEKQGDD